MALPGRRRLQHWSRLSSDAVNLALQRTAHTHDLRRVVRKDRIYGGVDIVLGDENGDGEGNRNQDGDHRAQQGAAEGGTQQTKHTEAAAVEKLAENQGGGTEQTSKNQTENKSIK